MKLARPQMPNYVSTAIVGLAFALLDAAIAYFEALPAAAETPLAAAIVGVILVVLRKYQPAPDEVPSDADETPPMPDGAVGAPCSMPMLTRERRKWTG